MVMLSTRIAFVQGACLFAAREASTSASFKDDLPTSKSATSVAQEKVSEYLEQFQGIKIISVTTTVKMQPIDSGESSERSDPLDWQDIDTGKYLYHYKVKLEAEVDPFIPYSSTLMDFPGLTKPLKVICNSQRICEKPQGLSK
jgi:hypothetical protein